MKLVHRDLYAEEPAVTQVGTCAPIVQKDLHAKEPAVTQVGTRAPIVHKDQFEDDAA